MTNKIEIIEMSVFSKECIREILSQNRLILQALAYPPIQFQSEEAEDIET